MRWSSCSSTWCTRSTRGPSGGSSGELIADSAPGARQGDVLFRLAEAAVRAPGRDVRDALYPVGRGADAASDLVAEAKANEQAFQARVRTVLRSSYSHHYRTDAAEAAGALEFRCNNTAYRPVMDALELLRRYADRDGRSRHYDRADRVPLDGVVPKATGGTAVVDDRGRVERIPYELCVLIGAAGRDAPPRDLGRRRQPAGATRTTTCRATSTPHRDVHYAALRQPPDPTEFIDRRCGSG